MKLLKTISAAAISLAVLGLSVTASANEENLPVIQGINSVVVFGDSLSDTGTITFLLRGVNQFNRGQGIPEVAVRGPRRFSNGDLWVDYLSESLNVPQFNFAVSGARAVGHDSALLQQSAQDGLFLREGYTELGLYGQVQNYVTNFSGDKATALHTILIGGNDIIGFLEGNSDLTNRQQVVERIVSVISASVFQLGSAGAKNIVVLTLPEIGDLPRFSISSALRGKSEEANLIVELVNRGLQDAFYKESRLTNLGYNVTTVNGARFFNNISSSGQFANPQQTWLQVIEQNGQISLVPDANGSPQVNGNPEDFIFWDSIHPTTRTHQLLSDQVLGELQQQSHCFANVANCSVSYELKLQ
ncbi:SGNH/GDSL hydrolase family protein [Pelagibaculum spongiae]|uniref:GDSL family lipase n=1 Tax=Pelagibaculum spongiae TaxID=2080658 RepID=A0A2V1H636_9GAMM|nr:SGNH/GDSL hydrolase family protein [Pelagibaculum spongiae]PVZ72215.1 hypothetical protein DC094_04150 [Pelagibaculum spongiae]